MSRLDAVIFGATGFTGKYTVIHMIEFAKKYQIGSWGVAARSEKKLNSMMNEASKKTGADLSGVKIIIADVEDEKSLLDMCAQTKVVINCCGPYQLYGESVVKAAIEKKTHYIDVSADPEFIERMQLRYNDLAREAGVFVVTACGWQSVAADMGVIFLQQHFNGTLNSVNSYLLTAHKSSGSLTKTEVNIRCCTWESLIYSLMHYPERPLLWKQLYNESLPKLKPKLTRQLVHRKDGKGPYYRPFRGADESVVYRSQRYFYEHSQQRPIQFKAYINSGSIFSTIISIIYTMILLLLTKFNFTTNLLLAYPKLFSLGNVSKEQPTDEFMKKSFLQLELQLELIGEGWDKGVDIENSRPNKRIVAKVKTRNSGYSVTSVIAITAALVLLQNNDKLPADGGVLTTGPLFKDTNFLQTLMKNGLKYELVETKSI